MGGEYVGGSRMKGEMRWRKKIYNNMLEGGGTEL